jgi:hypothetical protein
MCARGLRACLGWRRLRLGRLYRCSRLSRGISSWLRMVILLLKITEVCTSGQHQVIFLLVLELLDHAIDLTNLGEYICQLALDWVASAVDLQKASWDWGLLAVGAFWHRVPACACTDCARSTPNRVFKLLLIDLSQSSTSSLSTSVLAQQLVHFIGQLPDVNDAQRRRRHQMLAVLTEAHACGDLATLRSAQKSTTLGFEEHQLFVGARGDSDLPTVIEQHLQVIGHHLSVWVRALLPYLFEPLRSTQCQILVVPSEDQV